MEYRGGNVDAGHKEILKGIMAPVIGLGTWKMTGAECVEAVSEALKIGYRHIDTAEAYGNEEEIGEAIAGHDRKELFITSKLWTENIGYGSTIESFYGSLRRLKSGYIDLYLIHWPRKGADIKGTFRAFKEIIDSGKLRAAGVSNFTAAHLKEAMRLANETGIRIANNQVEFHPMLYQKELLEFCGENGISVTAYSPLARGDVMDSSILESIAKNHDATPAQVSISWLIGKGLIVIPKARSKKHLMENIKAAVMKLSDDEVKEIDGINATKRHVEPPHAEFERETMKDP